MCAGLRSAQLEKKKSRERRALQDGKTSHDAQNTKNLVLDQGVVDSRAGGKRPRLLYATFTDSSQVKGALDFSEKSHLTLSGALTESHSKSSQVRFTRTKLTLLKSSQSHSDQHLT